jgi:hypothetical protein
MLISKVATSESGEALPWESAGVLTKRSRLSKAIPPIPAVRLHRRVRAQTLPRMLGAFTHA